MKIYNNIIIKTDINFKDTGEQNIIKCYGDNSEIEVTSFEYETINYLFKLLFVSEQGDEKKSMYDLVNGSKENVVKEIKRASDDGISNAQQLFMKMWIYIHGAGCMAVTGDYDLDEATSVSMLESAYKAFSL